MSTKAERGRVARERCVVRRRRRVGSCFLLGLCLVAGLGSAGAEEYDYNAENDAAMALFRLGGSARGQALGGAYVSLARGAEAVYWNPGGIAYQKTRGEVAVSPRLIQSEDYELVDDGRSYFTAQASGRWRTWALGVGVQQLSSGDLLFNDGTSYEVDGEETFSNSQTGVIVAAGGTFLQDHLGVGLALRRLSSSFEGELGSVHEGETSGSGLAIQAGGIYRVSEDLAAGLTYELPSSVDWGLAEKDESATRIQTGASYRLLRGRAIGALVAVQLENVGGSWARVHVGGEATIMRKIAFRIGYRNLHLKSSALDTGALNETSTVTFGLGTTDIEILRSVPLSLDLAYDHQDFNSQIATTLRIGF